MISGQPSDSNKLSEKNTFKYTTVCEEESSNTEKSEKTLENFYKSSSIEHLACKIELQSFSFDRNCYALLNERQKVTSLTLWAANITTF